MADREEDEGPSEGAEAWPDQPDEDAAPRPRRSDLTRRERRRRRRRAARAARRGAARGRTRRTARPRTREEAPADGEADEVDRGVPHDAAPEATEGAGEPSDATASEAPDDAEVAAPEEPDDDEVAGAAATDVESATGGDEVADGPRRGRRRRRRERRAAVVPDTGEGDEAPDRTTSETLFDDGAAVGEKAAVPVDDEDVGTVDDEDDEAAATASEEGVEGPEEDAVAEDVPRHPPFVVGPITSAAPPRRRPRRAPVALLTLGAVAVAFTVGAILLGWIDLSGDGAVPDEQAEETREAPEDGWQPAFLLASVDDRATGPELRSLAVLASDRRDEQGTLLLLPTTTLADVPGFGSFTLREAWELGGSSLVAVTVDNLLGLRIDGVLAVDAAGWEAWFTPLEGATLSITAPIVPADGAPQDRFEPGTRHLDPAEVGRYALVRGQGESALTVLPRTRQVLAALLDEVHADPAVLDAVVEAARTFPGTATPERLRTVLGELAEAHARDDLTAVSLPVIPLGSGDEDLYRVDGERLESLVDERFAASRDDRAASDRWAVQILNGNGRPGVGQEVAEELADGSYRIVLTGNADRFTYRTTRIIVYDEEDEMLRAAHDVQERLGGIGTIERSGTPQSVVDLTIVVGHDFVR